MLKHLLSFALAAAAIGCGGSSPTGTAPPAMPPTDVTAITLAEKPTPDSSEFVATIQSLQSTTIQPQVEGFVRQILVKSGDRVRAGQALVQIDPDRQQATVTTIESQRAARESDLVLAQQQLARTQQLFTAGAISRAELEQAEAAQRNAQAQLTAVQSQIRETQVQLGYYRVTAPAAGVIGNIPVRAGDRVTPSTVITTIDQGTGLEAYVNVPLERSADVREGLTVELLDGAGKVIASNPITFVAPRADEATQSVLAKATLRQPPPGLRVLQYVRARVIWGLKPALTVPVVAVSRLAGQHFVFVADTAGQATVARQKPISVGAIVGDDYVITGGLKAGDRVIVSNTQKIGDGLPVNVRLKADATSRRGVPSGTSPAEERRLATTTHPS
jgi:RND family efflux transporter MFP subunit